MHRRSKDTDAKPVVDEEPAVESDNSGDAEDSAFKGKGSDHFGDAKKDENTASSDDKHLITDGNKAKKMIMKLTKTRRKNMSHQIRETPKIN